MYEKLLRFLVTVTVLGVAVLPLTGCPKQPEVIADMDPPPSTGDDVGDRDRDRDDSQTAPPPADPDAWMGEVQDIFFDFDRYELRSEARAILQRNARLLRENSGSRVVLEGHCDERGTEEYNLALGQRRADAVKAYLMDLGISGSRLSTVSYGEERPFALGSAEEAWSQNRRVHFRFQ